MAAKIKLKRIGARKAPMYRIVVLDESAPTKQVAIEVLGTYNPRCEPTQCEFKKEKVEEWLKKGAQPTDKVRILLGRAGILPPVDFTGKVKRKPRKEAAKEAEEGAKEGGAKAEAAPAAEKAEAKAETKAEAPAKEEPKKEEAKKEEPKAEAPKAEAKPEENK